MIDPKFDYDEEHALLRDEVRRWQAERCPISEVRRIAEGPRGDDPALWKELAELGWVGLAIAEENGGAGLGMTHLAVVLEETGRRLTPAPLLPVALAAMALQRGGSAAQREAWLPRIAAGEVVATLAHVEPSGGWRAIDTQARRSGGKLSGEKHLVWAAESADLFLVPFREADALRIGLVESGAAGVGIEPEVGIDPTRRSGRVHFREVALAEAAVLETPAEDVFGDLLAPACTALAAEMVGGADALLTMTAEYAATRQQFGKAIGSFQAIKHPLVDVLVGVEQTRSLVYAAASALDAGSPDAEVLARMAKASASDLYVSAASRAVQFHGGYGFTIECDAHLYMKRAQASRPAFGDARHHRAHIADLLLI